uniref:BZIP domain-containing protein n=1 Tax=Oryza punctata TaxID=4537 RepID=A0A0E0MJE8_ORYPU
MDDGEIELSSQMMFPNAETPTSLDDFLPSIRTTCTHTHTCNPPGPSATAHTHTCYHTHTQVFSTDDDSCGGDKPKRNKAHKPLGNREAVRKYRQKKKAHTAHLEEEVKRLRAINQQLLKRLQGQAALEAEVVRLRLLLVDVRSRINGALGCDGMAQCFAEKPELGVRRSCAPSIVNCHISQDSGQNIVVPHTLSPSDAIGSFMVSSTSKDELILTQICNGQLEMPDEQHKPLMPDAISHSHVDTLS